MNIKEIIKGIINIVLIITLFTGLILAISEVSETESLWKVVTVNGGGVALFCTSLLILSAINKDPDAERG